MSTSPRDSAEEALNDAAMAASDTGIPLPEALNRVKAGYKQASIERGEEEEELPAYRCPKCGSDSIDIQVLAWANLLQADPDNVETDVTSAKNGDHEWDRNSQMYCRQCDYIGPVTEFEVEREGNAG